MNIRSTILWVVAIAILGVVNYGVFQKEQLRTTGQLLYLELAPVDPRSLIQGDYMRLDYAVLRGLSDSDLNNPALPDKGQLLIDYDGQRIGTKAQIYDGVTAIEDEQAVINFRYDGWRWRIGADNFFFQEGQGDLFADAEYAELRVGASGEVVLVGLLGEELKRLE